jgi:hypothetical protein
VVLGGGDAASWHVGRGWVVGVSHHTDFLRAISEGTVTAVVTPVNRGRLAELLPAQI